MSGTERHLCSSLSSTVLNTAELSFLLLLTSSPVVLNVVKLCLSEKQGNSQFVLLVHKAVEWDSQLLSGTVLNSKGTVFPIKRSDSKRRFIDEMGN